MRGIVQQEVQRGRPAFPFDEDAVVLNPSHISIAVEHSERVRARHFFTGQSFAIVFHDQILVFRMDKIKKRLGFYAIIGSFCKIGGGTIGKLEHAVLGDDDALIGIINYQSIFFFRFQQRLFSFCSLNCGTEDISRGFECFNFNLRPLACRQAVIETDKSPPIVADENGCDHN